MLPILVVADDFSGAAELAGVAMQYGLTAEVHTDWIYPSDAQVIAIDTNSRSLPPPLVQACMEGIAERLAVVDFEWMFKKVDSVLRGNVLREQYLLQSCLSIQTGLILNANPRKGRTVEKGVLKIDGVPIDQTLFATDPEHPCRTASVVELLACQGKQVELIDGPQWLNQSRRSNDGETKVFVANCQTSKELFEYAAIVKQELQAHDLLVSGAAEFFEALLARFGFSCKPSPMDLQPRESTLVVSGTAVRTNRFALANFSKSISVDECQEDQDWVHLVQEAMKQSKTVTLSPGARTSLEGLSIMAPSPADVNEQQFKNLVAASVQVIQANVPRYVWIEGGRTASEVVRSLGWNQLRAFASFADGVVGLQPLDAGAPSIVVKPGSYRWPIGIDT